MPVLLNLPLYWWGTLGFVTYAAGCLIFGNVFPFSNFKLYARSGTRDRGALPTFWAAGQVEPIGDFEAFWGIDPEAIYPEGKDFQSSLDWQVREAQRWLREHAAKREEDAGDIDVEYGFRVLRVTEGGELTQKKVVTGSGRARRRG